MANQRCSFVILALKALPVFIICFEPYHSFVCTGIFLRPVVHCQYKLTIFTFLVSFRFSFPTEGRLLKSLKGKNARKCLTTKENFFRLWEKVEMEIENILHTKSLFIWEELMGAWYLLLSRTWWPRWACTTQTQRVRTFGLSQIWMIS